MSRYGSSAGASGLRPGGSDASAPGTEALTAVTNSRLATAVPRRCCTCRAGACRPDADAAGHREAPHPPGPPDLEGVQQHRGVPAHEHDRVRLLESDGREVDDPGDLVPVADGENGVEVGQVRLLDRHPPLEEGRRRGPAVPGDDDLLAQVGERERRMGADRAEPAGDEDHRVTGRPRRRRTARERKSRRCPESSRIPTVGVALAMPGQVVEPTDAAPLASA